MIKESIGYKLIVWAPTAAQHNIMPARHKGPMVI